MRGFADLASRAALAAVAVLTLVGCSADEGERASGPLRVVATTAILGEFASEVAGPDAEVVTLIPAGVDPHSFEPPTQAARAIAAADVVIVNGYGLEGPLLSVLGQNRRRHSVVVVAASGLEVLGGSEEVHLSEGESMRSLSLPELARAEGDPHLWLDPELAARYVETITEGLAASDPRHEQGYRARGQAATSRYRALRTELAAALAPIPPEQRRIVVFHDAFAYFAGAFDFQLSAGILPEHGGREPSAGALAETVALIRRERVPAIFGEPQFSSSLLDAVGRETGVRVLELYSDASVAGVHGYEAMMRANAGALVAGLAPAATR